MYILSTRLGPSVSSVPKNQLKVNTFESNRIKSLKISKILPRTPHRFPLSSSSPSKNAYTVHYRRESAAANSADGVRLLGDVDQCHIAANGRNGHRSQRHDEKAQKADEDEEKDEKVPALHAHGTQNYHHPTVSFFNYLCRYF